VRIILFHFFMYYFYLFFCHSYYINYKKKSSPYCPTNPIRGAIERVNHTTWYKRQGEDYFFHFHFFC
jgi:hypothetical protein